MTRRTEKFRLARKETLARAGITRQSRNMNSNSFPTQTLLPRRDFIKLAAGAAAAAAVSNPFETRAAAKKFPAGINHP